MVMRKGLGKGRGVGYYNIIPKYDSHRHSLNAQGYRMPQRVPNLQGGKLTPKTLQKAMIENQLAQSRYLIDNETEDRYSANAGDYWEFQPNDVIPNVSLYDSTGKIKEVVRKKDLVDTIYSQQKVHDIKTALRKPLKSSQIKTNYIGGYEFDNKGRFIVNGNPSDRWTFEGIANQYGRKVVSWEEYAKNPDILKNMKGSFYVMDMDNGTYRIQGKKLDKKNPAW